jgi:tetratricopeptide (TPR) repeat protein
MDEKALGPDSPELGTDLNNLGTLYLVISRYDEAQKCYQRALKIRIKAFGDHDPAVAETMNSYAIVLRGLKRDGEARQMEVQARAIMNGQKPK